ncbi:hypothetical protein [Aestuariibius sp. HNIBRBA575]|uniref:hypothetical protein n=1 Tax=Aestuariibius sp. HNIBRBA575 TaxID=3233343 RepID=UPI0034A21981
MLSFPTLVSRFLLYRVVSRFSFYVPIFVVALLAAGFSFGAVGGILFVYGVATMLFGGLARRVLSSGGPAMTIALGEVAKLGSNALIGGGLLAGDALTVSQAVGVLIAAQVLGGVGYCLAAVGDGSFLAHAGRLTDAPSEVQTRAQARSSSYMFMSFLAAGCVGAVVFQINPALPFFMTSAANLAAALVAIAGLRLAAPAKTTAGTQKADAGRLTFAAWLELVSYSFMRAVVLTLQLLILPVWFFLDLKIEVAFFGVLFGLYTFSGFLGGRFFPRLAERFGARGALAAVVGVTLASMLGLGLGSTLWVTVLAPVGMFCAAGMLRPAYLPLLTQAPTATGGTTNAVPQAEQVFGALSAAAYLACGLAFQSGWTPQQLVLGSTAFVAGVFALRAFLSTVGAPVAQPDSID